jgi:hypothetical protein
MNEDEEFIIGEVVDYEYSSEELELLFGTIRCTKCSQEINIDPTLNMGNLWVVHSKKCVCGIAWDLRIMAIGTKNV